MSDQPKFDETAFRQFERDGYSRVAEGYASKTALVSAQANAAILDAAQVGKGADVLDVACGPGLLTHAAIERGANVSAIDFAPKMVDSRGQGMPTRTSEKVMPKTFRSMLVVLMRSSVALAFYISRTLNERCKRHFAF